jgi:phosphatidylserine/phosphatidylglycerophosphate/cardiolipin synthase-like enzyme
MLVALGPTSHAEPAPADEQAKVAAIPAPPYSPRTSTVFNNPKGSRAAQETIATTINRSIDGSARGSTIRMAQYLFDLDKTTDKLVAAYRRGVNVQILIDDGERSSEIRRLENLLGTNKSRSSFVYDCTRSCMSNSTSVMHSKFYLFRKVGTTNYVSMVGSANPDKGNTYNSWNNLHTMTDKRIYASLSGYFFNLLKDKTDLNYYRTYTSGMYKLFYFPRRTGITYLSVLKNVGCRYGSGGRTAIRIGMWGWTAPRVDIARQLNTLQARGCRVEVVLNKARTSRTVFAALLKSTPNGRIKIYDAWYDGNDNGVAGLYIHNKVVAINGVWFGRREKVVYTGSQNFSEEGNRVNDELILQINNNDIHDAYVRNLNYIRDHWTKRQITSVPASLAARTTGQQLLADDGVPDPPVIDDAGPGRPMVDDDGFQYPVGGDVDFDG